MRSGGDKRLKSYIASKGENLVGDGQSYYNEIPRVVKHVAEWVVGAEVVGAEVGAGVVGAGVGVEVVVARVGAGVGA
jgi:hypothetical protein